MSPAELMMLFMAGVGAGAINTVVGAGTLITFPTLLAFGVPPVIANVSNALGLIPGGVSGTWGYRSGLKGQDNFLLRFTPASLVGAATGALLLLVLPPSVFDAVVPVLLFGSIALVLLQPSIQRRVSRRRIEPGSKADRRSLNLATMGVFAAGIYGGYFGAAQGVVLIGLLGAILVQDLQRTNALKNALSLVVTLVAGITYVVVAPQNIDWLLASVIAGGSLIGGLLGARIGRSLRPLVLRGLIVVVGLLGIFRIIAV